MSFGPKIADSRRKQNMTQEQLAELLSVTRQSVSRWESNVVYPEIDKIVKIAEILQVSCDDKIELKEECSLLLDINS